MELVFDTSVWVDHLRNDRLAPVLPRLRGRYQLWMDGIVAAELLAGCRSRIERRVVEGLVAPFRWSSRLRSANADDLVEAGLGLSLRPVLDDKGTRSARYGNLWPPSPHCMAATEAF